MTKVKNHALTGVEKPSYESRAALLFPGISINEFNLALISRELLLLKRHLSPEVAIVFAENEEISRKGFILR